MNMNMNRQSRGKGRRHYVLAAALAATLAATLWLAVQPEEDAATSSFPTTKRTTERSTERSTERAPSVASAVAAKSTANTVNKTSIPRSDWPAVSAVAAAAWGTKPPEKKTSPINATALAKAAPQALTAPTAPTAPAPPAFPYTLIGQLDDGQPRALLTGPVRSLAVSSGEVIDGVWRVEAVQAQSITLIWLPGGQRQTLAFKAS